METKMIRVHFDVELAKKITNGKVEGKIVTRNGKNVRIVCFDRKSELNKFPILALIENEKVETSYIFNPKGYTNFYGLETSSDLFFEIPEYMTFKDGDVLSYDGGTFILKRIDGKDRAEYYANFYGICTAFDSACSMKNLVNHLRISTEEEKIRLIASMKESKRPESKEYLKRFFGIEEKPEYEFKPFDKVLVRQSTDDKWEALFFSNKTENVHKYRCCGMNYLFCIPYNEQTAHLLGTNKDWEENK